MRHLLVQQTETWSWSEILAHVSNIKPYVWIIFFLFLILVYV